MIMQIKKRDGKIVRFDSKKIHNAIEKAMREVGEENPLAARRLTDKVIEEIEAGFLRNIPTVEQVQEIVEEALSFSEFQRTAKAYMLYRRARSRAREMREFFGLQDDLKFGVNAIRVLQERYLLRDEKGKIIETPTQLFRRVACALAKNEKNRKKWENVFYNIMERLDFLPNTPTLMNAGTKIGQLSACFVLPIEDDLRDIFHTLETAALIQQSGGGTGFSFSRLRPKGSTVKSTKGVSSGPVSFMRIYDLATETIKQGGKRRGANMGVLHVSHPDIEEFVSSKRGGGLSNFNISVAADDAFMNAVKRNGKYSLVDPHTNKVAKQIPARKLFNQICQNAWETGDPGMLFIDEINRKQPTPKMGWIEATNPCGEIPLLPNEACNLGSINVANFVKDKTFDWGRLKESIHTAVRFLDNVIDVNAYSTREIERAVKGNRKIGLGIMGFSDALVMLGIPYDTQKALGAARTLMKFMQKEARNASMVIGKEKGSFPNLRKSRLQKYRFMRNATVTTIAPTGTISIIAGCSSGIEPLFAVAYVRRVMGGKQLFDVNNNFQRIAVKKGFHTDALMKRIAKEGTVQKIREVPASVKRLFCTALEISPAWHIRMQAVFQSCVDNAVSKTINLPENASVKDVANAYLLARKLKCKGITIYRYGSKKGQVLVLGKGKKYTLAEEEYTGETCGSVCTY